MPEMNRAKSGKAGSCSNQNNNRTLAERSSNDFTLMGRLDGQMLLQAIVVSELLDKPKAKRRKRGRFIYEGTHCR